MELSRQALADLTSMALADLLRARRAWDEPPALHFMYNDDGSRIRISGRSLVPECVWASGPPAQVLAGLARNMTEPPYREALVALAPESFHGVVFRCETWTVATPVSDEAAVRRAQRAAHRRRLYAHPGRVEQRTVWAMTRMGMFTAFQTRGQDRIDTQRVEGLEGDVPDALMTMFRAVVSRSAPLPAGFGGGGRRDTAGVRGRPSR
jgi:hypothetical protein